MFGKRVGFLKFKADVIHKETGNKVPHDPVISLSWQSGIGIGFKYIIFQFYLPFFSAFFQYISSKSRKQIFKVMESKSSNPRVVRFKPKG